MQNAENTARRMPAEQLFAQATEQDKLALVELAQWMERHQSLLYAGRARGISIGVTPSVAEFIADHIGGATGANLVQNLHRLPEAYAAGVAG
ncbi:TPA: hypothetical protein ACNIEH_005925 [Pseudomonas aeruginosa]